MQLLNYIVNKKLDEINFLRKKIISLLNLLEQRDLTDQQKEDLKKFRDKYSMAKFKSRNIYKFYETEWLFDTIHKSENRIYNLLNDLIPLVVKKELDLMTGKQVIKVIQKFNFLYLQSEKVKNAEFEWMQYYLKKKSGNGEGIQN
jgi:hypothetical protein